jgi:hypothetical protein
VKKFDENYIKFITSRGCVFNDANPFRSALHLRRIGFLNKIKRFFL